MSITFRRATAADAESLVKIQISAFHHDTVLYPGVEVGGPPGYDSTDSLLEKIQQDDCYKIMVDEQCIGGIVVFDKGQGHCHLDILYIDPDYHNRGIGTQAMQFLDGNYSAEKWTLDTPEWAVRNRHFYEKFGYLKVKEIVYDSITLIAYEKHL